MKNSDFAKLKNEFIKSDLERKIEIYAYTENLTEKQYKQLLINYPADKLDRLEKALSV